MLLAQHTDGASLVSILIEFLAYFSPYSDELVLVSYQSSNNLNIALHFLNMSHDICHFVLPRAGEIGVITLFYKRRN